jgi:protein-S-isoprenylcysteine O-methyltransferase Ste14
MKIVAFPDDQPIETGYWAVLIAPLGPAMIWLCGVTEYLKIVDWLMTWYLALGAALILVDYGVRRETLEAFFRAPERSWGKTLEAAAWRWGAWTVLIFLAMKLYEGLPNYSDDWYNLFKLFLRVWVLPGWLLFGLPYAIVTLRRRSSVRWDRKDPAVFLLLIGRGLPWGRWNRILRTVFRPRASRVVWMSLVVKFFFIPIMFKFYLDNGYHLVKDLEDIVRHLQGDPEFSPGLMGSIETGYYFCNTALIFIDVCLASLGYFITMRWLDSGMRSVDLSLLGWASCLACYMPFNKIISWQMGMQTADITLIAHPGLRLAAMAGVLLCLGVYTWSTLAFGLRFSNMTHRGLFTRGPYAFVRHPAYVAKNLSWWIESAPNLHDLRALLCLLGWNGIYYLRAVTEERHLSLDPRYKTYMRKVKNRFFPHISFKNK